VATVVLPVPPFPLAMLIIIDFASAGKHLDLQLSAYSRSLTRPSAIAFVD